VISFRYHLVTVVAVFLALGLGVVAGTTVVDQGLVSRLQEQTGNANRSAELARDRAGELGSQLSRTTGLIDQVLPLLTAGKLDGNQMVVVTDDGADAAMIDSVTKLVSESGGDVTAVLSLTDAAAVDDAKSREELATLLEVSQASSSEDLQAEMASQLATRLAEGVHGEQDRLFQLLEAGFLEAGQGNGPQKVNGQLPDVGGPAQSVIVVSGGVGTPPVQPSSFIEPLVGDLVDQGAYVVAAEPGSAAYPFVSDIRDSGLNDSGAMVTVDDADEPAGEYTLVEALGSLLRGEGGGDYGFKSGATDGLFPPLAR